MKFCPTCKNAAQRYYRTRYCDENVGRFETIWKLVYGTLDDSCNNITSYFFLLLVSFHLLFTKCVERGHKYFIRKILFL